MSFLDQIEKLIIDKTSNDKGYKIERFTIKDVLLGYPESYMLMVYKPKEDDIIRKGFKTKQEVAEWLNTNGWSIKEKHGS